MCKCSQEQSKMWPAGGMKGTNPIYLLSKKTIWQFRNTAIYFEIKESKNLYGNNTMGLALRRITPNLSFQGKDQRTISGPNFARITRNINNLCNVGTPQITKP